MTTVQIMAIAFTVLYIVLILILAKVLSKKSGSDGGVGARRLPWYIIAATTMATITNAAQLLGNAGSTYQIGISQMFWTNIICVFCFIITVPLMGERLRYVECNTLSDVVGKRFPRDNGAKALLNIWFLVWGVFACALSVFGGAVVLQTLLGINFWVACIVTLLVSVIYNAVGGLEAMAVVDTIQYIFIGVMVGILLPIAMIRFGSFSELAAGLVGTLSNDLSAAGEALGLNPGFFDIFSLPGWGASGFIAYMCACALWACCDIGVQQRLLAERKPGEGVKGVIAYAVIFTPTILILCFVGVWGRAVIGAEAIPDSIVLLFAQNAMGNVGMILFVIAAVAAILSTIGAYLNALGLQCEGLYAKLRKGKEYNKRRVEVISTVIIAVISVLAASIFGNAGIAITAVAIQMIMVATLTPLMILMVTWKRFNGKAAFWGMLIGIIVCIASTIYAGGAYPAIMGNGFFGIPTLFLGWIVAIPIYVIPSLIIKPKEGDMSPEFEAMFSQGSFMKTYPGKKSLIVSIILIIVAAVIMVLGFKGTFGPLPRFDTSLAEIVMWIFSVIAFFGVIFLGINLWKFLFGKNKEFFGTGGEAEIAEIAESAETAN